ncbi:GumC family protein [Actibacterium pelagium]|uniref:Uncharacterized protein n=1 Tax=Actibacterium pelagium TaxID=2029103 RepID=A0A917EPE2_9RHOB|nr:hypothetical protein [Actibacterium pelagium]GGE62483.1 hypothetical protein GCM10011517_32760 [Actibacterium pelagium]
MSILTALPKPRQVFAIVRQPLRQLRLSRILMGGRLTDAGRLPRYIALFALGSAAIWAPITGYLKTAPLKYSSHLSLILPGSGASASVNLNNIGQASSYANSAFSSNSISPTETYKRLLGADRVVRAAAASIGHKPNLFGSPRVRLVDQTAFIHVEMVGPSPEAAQKRATALLNAFFTEIDRLRSDEMATREDSGLGAIREYKASVAETRAEITRLQQDTGLHSAEQFTRQVDANDSLRAQVDTLATELKRKEGAVARLQARLGTDAQQAALILLLNSDSAYLALLETLASQAAELTDAQSRYGMQHPAVERAQSALNAARAAAVERATTVTGQPIALERMPNGGRAELLTDLVQQEADRNGLAAQFDELSNQLQAQTARLDRLAPLAARLEDRQRDFKVAEAVFASAIARQQSSKTDIFASYPLVQVLEDPTLAESPSSPRRKLAVAAGGAASFMLFMALVLAWIRKPVIGYLLAKGTPKS